jgi:hypothetical protein
MLFRKQIYSEIKENKSMFCLHRVGCDKTKGQLDFFFLQNGAPCSRLASGFPSNSEAMVSWNQPPCNNRTILS